MPVASHQKAINKEEGPTKEKHIRTILMGTYKDESARLFWSIALKLPLQGHPIGHLKDGYGRPIQAFARLIVAKLKFHKKKPEVPGTMSLTPEVMASLTQNSIDNYFELSVDLLDYLDELLVLQNAVFASLDKSKANSMTLHGQCKLSPLIQCLQDSAGLYDALVFYDTCYNLQYYKNLVSVPQLPDKPPNFLVSSDLSHHRAPVVATVWPALAPRRLTMAATTRMKMTRCCSGALVYWVQLYGLGRGHRNWCLSLAGMQQPHPAPATRRVFAATAGSMLGGLRPALLDFGGSNSAAAADALFGPASCGVRDLNPPCTEMQSPVVWVAALEQATAAKLRAEERLSEIEKRVKLLESKGDFEERYTKLKTMYQQLREEHINLLKQSGHLPNRTAHTRRTRPPRKETSGLKQSLDEAKRSLAEQKNQLAHLQDLHDMSAGGGGGSNGSDSQQAELNDLRRRQLEASMTAASTEKSSLSAELEARQAEVDRLAQENFAFTESVRPAGGAQPGQELELAAVGQRLAEATGAAEAAAAERTAWQRWSGPLETPGGRSSACLSGVEKISETLEHFDDPALISCRTSAEFLLGRIDSLLAEVESLESNGSGFLDDETAGLNDFVASIHGFTARACEAILQGRIVSNAAPTADLVQAARGLAVHR
uniref:Centrosomal protein of 70 kDa n=1 Tax=Macrostomum lignano TaxID=282301 RepID=A0A1I8JPX0_9PLAT